VDIASSMLPITEESADFSVYELDNTALTQLVSFQKKNNPRLQGKSNRDIAEACGMSENTLCAILKGKNRNPRVATLVCILRTIGGGSIDRLVGLAPHRDFAKEEALYDATLVEAMQVRLDEKRQRIEELTTEVSTAENECTRLRKMYNEVCMELSSARARLEAMQAEVEEGKGSKAAKGQVGEMEKRLADKGDQLERYEKQIDEQKTEIRKLRLTGGFVGVLLVITLLIVIYLLWEMANPNLGNFRY